MRARAALIALAVAGASLPATAQPTTGAAPRLSYALPGRDVPEAPPRSAPPWAAPRPTTRLFSDAALHALGSGLLTVSGHYVLTDKAGLSERQALPVAAATALALGLAKEIADARRVRHPEFSWPDLVGDAFGVALGAAIVGL